MKTAIALAFVGSAFAANAEVTFRSIDRADYGVAGDAFGVLSDGTFNGRVAGDTVDAAITAFTPTAGGSIISGASHTVGGVDVVASAAPGLITDHVIISNVSTVGTTRTLTVFYGAAAVGGQLADPGIGLNGLNPLNPFESFDSIFFEIPDLNGGPDLFDDADKVGAASGDFFLLGTDGSVLFSTAAGVTDNGTSFSLGNGVTTGAGSNVFGDLGGGVFIEGGQFQISYEIVPAPASAALLGLGGLFAGRRRG